MRGDKALEAYFHDNGTDFYHEDRNGCASTFHAAHLGVTEIVQLLIDSGADPQHPTLDGWTPLHSCYAYPEITHALLKNGVDLNSLTKLGSTPLFLGAYSGVLGVVKVLLSYKPILELTTVEGASALTAATNHGNTEVIRLLLKAGANYDHQSGRNTFPLQFAIERSMEDVVRLLMEHNSKINLVDDDGDTALDCITHGTIAQILVNGGADLNIRNKHRDTPIRKAVSSSNREVVKYPGKKAKLDVCRG